MRQIWSNLGYRAYNFFVPVTIVGIGFIGFLLLYEYLTWERYAYPPLTYYGLVGGVVCLFLAVCGVVAYFSGWTEDD